MSIVQRKMPLKMCRENLMDTPHYVVPVGYSIRPYLPGDEQTWVLIQSVAGYNKITLELFRREFGDDPDLLGRRQFFLVDPDGRAVGTATAWFKDNRHGQPLGRVHWVAIHPDSQGAGLSKPLLSKVCATLRELGHSGTYLTTSTARIPAIALYLRFGFTPLIKGPADAAAWAEVKSYLPGPAQHQDNAPNQPSDTTR